MDERQQQGLREGAGLEESRLNTEFIDFIQRWGGPFLLLCAAIMGAWAGWNWWQRQKAERLDAAYAQYEAQVAPGNPSPEALKAVADEFEGVGSVSMLARLDAADIYAASVRSGVRAGATLNPDGTLANPEDALTDEDRARLIEQATALYQRVLDAAASATGKGVLAIRAAYGLAAMAETRGDLDAARGHYQRLIEIAEANRFSNHVEMAQARLDGLGSLSSPIAMLSRAQLPERPAPPEPVLPELQGGAGPAGPALAPSDPLSSDPLLNPLGPNPLNPEGQPPLTPEWPGPTSPSPTPPGEPTTPPATPEPGSTEPASGNTEPEPGNAEPAPPGTR